MPRKRESEIEKFIPCPTANPIANVPKASDKAITIAFLPIFFNFSIGNSIPTTNNNKTIPISENKFKHL